jgi:hypothetical protein
VETVTKKEDRNPSDVSYILKDLLQGDSGVALRSQFDALTKPEINDGLNETVEKVFRKGLRHYI